MTEASAKIQKESQRGREADGGEGEGRRDGKTKSLTLFPGLRASFIPAGTKTSSPSPALSALPSNPHQHAPYHIHAHGRDLHTHTHARAHIHGIFASQEEKEVTEGGSQG